ncbi:antifreeze protein [Brucella sp. BE17]|uniref:antifreeze protein n=1 Tax=Brucella sp. BE17 TaxID=3142977 RepID=UPI0031BA56C6
MKKAALAFAVFATTVAGFSIPSYAASAAPLVEVQYHGERQRPSRDYRPDDRRPGWDRPDRRSDWGKRQVISPRGVKRTLERRGYAVGDIRLQRGSYAVRATRPNGRRVIVSVDAYSGRIINERRVARR